MKVVVLGPMFPNKNEAPYTTFIYPPEVFPTKVRGFGSGASAAGGKVGAFVGTLLNVMVIATISESGLFIVLSMLSVMGLILTVFLLPEPKRLDLEESSGENTLLAAGKGMAAHK